MQKLTFAADGETQTEDQKKADTAKVEESQDQKQEVAKNGESEKVEEEEEELIGGIFREITAKNCAKYLGDSRTRRMIYLYKTQEGLGQVAQFAV